MLVFSVFCHEVALKLVSIPRVFNVRAIIYSFFSLTRKRKAYLFLVDKNLIYKSIAT